ncbi:hypothetical protein [Lapillicoccus sp.]|uniref:hypothetical protein n=1 Tax=Lapillicoccus sp. TaxID=1909287 RepID=UPI00326514B8
MTHFTTRLAARLATELATRGTRIGRRDRGDVPGWVLITVMTAGLVTAIWVLARPALESMFTTALNGVKGP